MVRPPLLLCYPSSASLSVSGPLIPVPRQHHPKGSKLAFLLQSISLYFGRPQSSSKIQDVSRRAILHQQAAVVLA
jgi:hypothetical protein